MFRNFFLILSFQQLCTAPYRRYHCYPHISDEEITNLLKDTSSKWYTPYLNLDLLNPTLHLSMPAAGYLHLTHFIEQLLVPHIVVTEDRKVTKTYQLSAFKEFMC